MLLVFQRKKIRGTNDPIIILIVRVKIINQNSCSLSY